MTVLFKSVQFNCLSICHSAIICITIIFVIIWLPKYMRNRTLVSKWLSNDRKVVSSVTTAFKVHYNQKLGGTWPSWGRHHGLWGIDAPILFQRLLIVQVRTSSKVQQLAVATRIQNLSPLHRHRIILLTLLHDYVTAQSRTPLRRDLNDVPEILDRRPWSLARPKTPIAKLTKRLSERDELGAEGRRQRKEALLYRWIWWWYQARMTMRAGWQPLVACRGCIAQTRRMRRDRPLARWPPGTCCSSRVTRCYFCAGEPHQLRLILLTGWQLTEHLLPL